MLVSVSFLKSMKSKEDTIKEIEASSADYIHVDIMDGWFAGELNYTWEEMQALLENHQKPLDIHLMTIDLERQIKEAMKLNPEFITFHYEACEHPEKIIEEIKKSGIKVGMSINPETPVKVLTPFLEQLDLVLMMGVNPGYGGQEFILNVTLKLQELKKLQKGKKFLISVDGGIDNTIKKLVAPYTDIIVSGSYICMNENYEKNIQKLKA